MNDQPAQKRSPFGELSRRSQLAWQAFRARPPLERSLDALGWLALLSVGVAYLVSWLHGNWAMLTDANLQTDDARTTLFPFHRYGSQGTLGEDPIAAEMLALVPPAVRLLYRVLSPVFDIFVAAKIVQGMALAILLWAGAILARSRRVGVAGAVLLVFALLHDPFAVGRIAGGLPRAFAFPCFALWLAGILAERRNVRFAATILAGLTYPSAMNMLLAAEGLYSLRGLGRLSRKALVGRLRRYGFLVLACVVVVLPAVVGDDTRGPIHTLAEAEAEPAFGKSGRLWLLPFDRPSDVLGRALIAPLKPFGGSPVPALQRWAAGDAELTATLLLALLLLVPLLRLGPVPWAALCFGAGSVILYFASRVLAFRLYSPERYYSFGMRMTLAIFLVGALSQLYFKLPARRRQTARNWTVALFILGFWGVTGNGVARRNGMEIDARSEAGLYAFIRTLPKDSRFAAHILDADGIPLFGARANTGGFETLQPWFVDSWRRQKQRAFATLDALYATDRQAVLDFAEREHVSHFLINKNRYGAGAKRAHASFQPFSDYSKRLLSAQQGEALVFDQVPRQAVLFTEGRYRVVSVARLRSAWNLPPGKVQ